MISFGIDPASLIISLIALWVACREIKRSRSAELRVLNFTCTSGMDVRVENGKPYLRLEITLRNCGVSLHDVSGSLCFYGLEGGLTIIPFRPVSFVGHQQGEFACGMVTVLSVSTSDLTEAERLDLFELTSIRKQIPYIAIYSQNYLVRTVQLVTLRGMFGRAWNKLGWPIFTQDLYTTQLEYFIRDLPRFYRNELDYLKPAAIVAIEGNEDQASQGLGLPS